MSGLRICILMLGSVSMLSACETTGDPRAGGLFGWSESKAQVRQQDLQHEADAANTDSRAEQSRKAALEQTETGLSVENDALRGQLSSLLSENQRLNAQLRDLLAQKRVTETQRTRMRTDLDQNERIRKAATTSAGNAQAASGQLLDSQNQRLHQDILFLLSN
jgi:septal ring factor EnvC (AmiA/AmiB activator)